MTFWQFNYKLTHFLADHTHHFHDYYTYAYQATQFFGIFNSLVQ